MKYKTTSEIASAWSIKPTQVTYLCRVGKIVGALRQGKSWLIPENAKMPLDGRRKEVSQPKSQLPLPVGVSDFKEAVSSYYYVDKTLMIKDIIDTLPKVTLFTRPRRFGKTMNMDMLRVYFEKTKDDTSVYFHDKKIWNAGEKYRGYQGKYPVIYLSFKDVKYPTFEQTMEKMRELLQLEFLRHQKRWGKKNGFSKVEMEYVDTIVERKANEVDFSSSLLWLSRMLHSYYGVAPIIIVDEYDTPIEQGYAKGYYEEIIAFMRNLFSGAFKDNPHLSFGFLTGILRVAKESIFSGMNNLIENSVLSESFSEYFGFTKDETKAMLDYYGAGHKFEEACSWYDGYLFGKTEIFNPWSIVNYIREGYLAKPYWQNTGSNDIIRQIVSSAPYNLLCDLQDLLQGKPVFAFIDTSVIYPEIKDNPETVFSFLLLAGYLKIANIHPIAFDEPFCQVVIPNKEIQSIYSKEVIASWNSRQMQSTATKIRQAILFHDGDALQTYLREYLSSSVSLFDVGKESFYHGLMLGLAAMLNNLYEVESNMESGEGRFDIALKPLDKANAGIIMELKVLHRARSNDETAIQDELESLANDALKQVQSKHYDQKMKYDGITTFLKYGIAFYKKSAMVIMKKE